MNAGLLCVYCKLFFITEFSSYLADCVRVSNSLLVISTARGTDCTFPGSVMLGRGGYDKEDEIYVVVPGQHV